MLALRLHRAGHVELAMRIGLAVDSNRPSVSLTVRERTLILGTLGDCPAELIPLKDAL